MNAPKISRRAFLTKSGLGCAAVGGYSEFIESGWLDIKRHDVNTGSPHQPVKLLHLSDLHASWCVSLGYIQRAIRLGLSLKPDLICVTGDFITNQFNHFEAYVKVLSELPSAAPAYACLGNHDGGCWAGKHSGHHTTDWVCDLLEKSGIHLLHNRSVDITVKNRKLRLAGVGDLYAREVWPQLAFPKLAEKTRPYTLFLAHNPDSKDQARACPWDLMLSGHTHGGQIYLPVIGAPFAPVIDKRFIAGLHPWNDRLLHVTRGVGNMYGLRLNCRPEVNLLTLA